MSLTLTGEDYDQMCADQRPLHRPSWSGDGQLIPLRDADGRQVVKRWGLLWSVPLFEFRSNRFRRLTLHATDGRDYQPDLHFTTDGGSIPPPLWGLPGLSPLLFPYTYALHDSAFKYGGLWVNGTFTKLTRIKANNLTLDGIRAEGGSIAARWQVRTGLALGSWAAWDDDRQAEARARDGIA
jgi:hypothetical protein